MKVNAFRSIGAKLFYSMGLLVLITVGGNSLQSFNSFVALQQEQVQDQIQLAAERSATQVDTAVDAWRSQIAMALPTLRGLDPKSGVGQLQRFVDANPDFLSLELFEAPSPKSPKLTSLGSAFTSTATDPRFEDKVPAKLREQVPTAARSWLKKQSSKSGKSSVLVESLAKNVGLPVMAVAVRFEVAGTPSVVWALLTGWQTQLIKALPKSRFIDSAVVDGTGKIFTSPNAVDMLGRKMFASTVLLKAALAATSPVGFQSEYADAQGRRRLGAFARTRHNLTVLVEQDAEVVRHGLWQSLGGSALVATLFLLLAAAFAYFGAASVNRRLRAVASATSKVAAGDFKHEIRQDAKDEVGALARDFNDMSRKIAGLMSEQIQRTRLEKELETAKAVQSTLFPRAEFRNGPIFLTGFYQPAPECGGDLWGHYTIGDGVEFVFIGDAMDRGASAALVTAMAYSTIMTIADMVRENPRISDSPAKVLERLNRVLFEAVRGSVSMTFFAAVVDTKKGHITFANAGHNFPVLVPAEPADPRIDRRRPVLQGSEIQPISLKLRGTPLGMEAATKYTDRSLSIRAGDKLLLFTDGLIECSSPKGEVWGRRYLIEQAIDTANLAPTDMKDELLSRAFTFFGSQPLDDDVTAVILEVSRNWAGGLAGKRQPAFKVATLAREPKRHALPGPPLPRPQGMNDADSPPALAEVGLEMPASLSMEATLELNGVDLASSLAMSLMPQSPDASVREAEMDEGLYLQEALADDSPDLPSVSLLDDTLRPLGDPGSTYVVASKMEDPAFNSSSDTDLVRALTEATLSMAESGDVTPAALDLDFTDDARPRDSAPSEPSSTPNEAAPQPSANGKAPRSKGGSPYKLKLPPRR